MPRDEGLPFPDYVGFPPMPQIEKPWNRGTFFVTVKPGMIMMTMGNDGALAFCCEPTGPTTSRLTVSSLFPKTTVARNHFEEIAKNDYRRNDIVVKEGVDISLRQAAGIASPFARMVTLQKLEKPLNQIANWILDKVLAA